MNRGLKLLLVFSVLLNLLLVGLVVGHVMRQYDRDLFTSVYRIGKIGLLDQETHQKLDAQLQKAREDNKPLQQQLVDARQKAVVLLSQEPFDRAALEAHIAGTEHIRAAIRARLTAFLLDAAESLPAPNRTILVDILNLPTPPSQSSSKARQESTAR